MGFEMVSTLFQNLTPLVLTATIVIIMLVLRVSVRVMQKFFFPNGKVSCSLTVHVESHLYDFLLEPATLVQALPWWGCEQ